MGDKSPKSKKRDEKQKSAVKTQRAVDAKAKQKVAAPALPGKKK